MEYQPHGTWLEKALAESRRRRRAGLILLAILAAVIVIPLMVLGLHWLAEVWPPWAVASSIIVVFVVGPWIIESAYRRSRRLAEIEKRLDKLERGSR